MEKFLQLIGPFLPIIFPILAIWIGELLDDLQTDKDNADENGPP